MRRGSLLFLLLVLPALMRAQCGQADLKTFVRSDAWSPSLLTTPLPSSTDILHLGTPWSYQRLGVFCKLDVQLERRLRIPVLFRLGDVRQVEAWEGKGPQLGH